MNELKAYDFHGKKVIDSRDVAQMEERPHNDLLKSIRTYSEYLAEGDFSHSDFFVESSYLDKSGMIKETYEAVGFPVPTVFPKQLPGQTSLFDTPALV